MTSQSQVYRLTGDLNRLQAFRERPLSYFRTIRVPPGAHRLDVVVQDLVANRSSTAELALEPDYDSGIAIGDLFLVDAIERVSARDAQEHPFGSGRTIVTPRAHDVIDRRGRDRIVLGLPLVARGRVDGRLALSGSRGQLAEIPVSFEPADRDEIIRLIELPVGSLPPGTYEIRLTINAGSRTFVRRTAAVLVDSAEP